MKTEEKAKKYDEALEWMKKVYPTLTGADKEDAEHYFPELKESEDERIIRAIIDALYSHTNSINLLSSRNYQMEDIEAWLEKQKDSTSNSFDDVWDEEDCEEIIAEGQKLTPRFKELLKEVCHAWYDKGAKLEKQKKQKPAEVDEYKIIKKHITEDSLSSEVNKRLTECGWYVTDEKPVEWSEEDIYITNVLEYIIGKHRSDTIFKIGNKPGISAYKICSWLKSLQERFNLEPKKLM